MQYADFLKPKSTIKAFALLMAHGLLYLKLPRLCRFWVKTINNDHSTMRTIITLAAITSVTSAFATPLASITALPDAGSNALMMAAGLGLLLAARRFMARR